MWTLLAFSLGGIVLFSIGLRLSAFFSGNETGFYRVSFPRLTIEAHSGDRAARRLLWFAQRPAYFVATTLVGNNVANYVQTLAIGLATAALAPGVAGLEIVITLLASPIIFVFGDLVPKSLYYRAPLRLLRRDVPWFVWFFRLFFVVTCPLVQIARIFERLNPEEHQPLSLMVGRSRLMHVLQRGHQEGLLTDSQNRMINGLLQTASQSVRDSVIPADRVLGVPDDTPRAALLDHGRKFGLTNVAVRRASGDRAWYGYVRIVDAAIDRSPLHNLIRTMPRVDVSGSKLEALLALRDAGEVYGAAYDGERFVGVVNQRGLVEQLFRGTQAPAAQFALPG